MRLHFLLPLMFILPAHAVNNHSAMDSLPSLFAEGTITSVDDEGGGTLSPDGSQFFFTKKSPSTGRSNIVAICVATQINKQWSRVSIASFSGKYRDFNPQFSPDGSRLYFISNRPLKKGDPSKPDTDIWFVKKTTNGWSEPENAGDLINSPYSEQSCSFTNDGTMYLSSERDGKSLDIYTAALFNGSYQAPQQLDSTINSPGPEFDACIAPGGEYLLFTSIGREDMVVPVRGAIYPRSDIYISRRQEGHWTAPVLLPQQVNTVADEGNASLSRDGNLLFFTSRRSFVSHPIEKALTYTEFEDQLHGIYNGFGNIFVMPAKFLHH